MALSRAEKTAVLKRIGDFLENEFAPVLAHYYARSVAYAAKHPQNINNELRNAVTHMSRALAAADVAAAHAEMDAAQRHVERFKRDCLKVAVIYAGKDAAKMIRQVEATKGKLNPSHHIECASIVGSRYNILIQEVMGDSGSATRWEALLLRIERLREDLIQNHSFLDRKRFGIPWAVALLVKWFFRLSAFVVATILAAAVAAAAIPNETAFGEKAQRLIISVTAKLFGTK